MLYVGVLMWMCLNKLVLIFERKELIFKCVMYLFLISIECGDLIKVLYIFFNGCNLKLSGYSGGRFIEMYYWMLGIYFMI